MERGNFLGGIFFEYVRMMERVRCEGSDRIKGEEEEEKKEIFAANGTEKTSFDSIPCEK